MTTYYISTSGDDGNAGTSTGAPKASWSSAYSSASNGDSILFNRGDTWSVFAIGNTVAKELTIGAYGSGNKPILDNNKTLLPYGAKGSGFDSFFKVTADNAIIEDLDLRNSSGQGVEVDEATSVTIRRLDIDWTYFAGIKYKNDCHNIRVYDNHIKRHNHGYGEYGAHVGGVETDWSQGINVGRNSSTAGDICDDIKVYNNIVERGYGEGIGIIGGSNDAEVYSNICYQNRRVGVYLDGATDTQVYDNLIFGSKTSDTEYHNGSSYIMNGIYLATENKPYNTGIVSNGLTITNNYIACHLVGLNVGNSDPLSSTDFSNVKIAYNTFVDNDQQIARTGSSNIAGAGCIFGNNAMVSLTSGTVDNSTNYIDADWNFVNNGWSRGSPAHSNMQGVGDVTTGVTVSKTTGWQDAISYTDITKSDFAPTGNIVGAAASLAGIPDQDDIGASALPSGGSTIAVTPLQSNTKDLTTNATTVTATFPSTPTAGNILLANMSLLGPRTVDTLSGWTLIESLTSADATAAHTGIWWYKESDGTETTVSPTWDTITKGQLIISEWDATGLDLTAPVVKNEDNTKYTSGAAQSVGTGTAVNVNAQGLAFAFFAMDSRTQVDAGVSYSDGFTERLSASSGTDIGLFLANKALTDITSNSCTRTTGDTGDQSWGSILVFEGSYAAAPTLTGSTATATSATTADGTISTDTSGATLSEVITESATKPTPTQVAAGQDHTGTAVGVGKFQSKTVIASGLQSQSFTGLDANTNYYKHSSHGGSDVVTASFTTEQIPVITLLGDNPLTWEAGTVFVDPGATATDNEDGDISASITTTGSVTVGVVGLYAINYDVVDSSGDSALTVQRVVNVVDTDAPVITLKGGDINLIQGEVFTEPGYTAVDAVDGVIDV